MKMVFSKSNGEKPFVANLDLSKDEYLAVLEMNSSAETPLSVKGTCREIMRHLFMLEKPDLLGEMKVARFEVKVRILD
jgi:hypothetical protein